MISKRILTHSSSFMNFNEDKVIITHYNIKMQSIYKENSTDQKLLTYIGVELPDKTGEIVVLEESGEKAYGKGLWVPHYEAVIPCAP